MSHRIELQVYWPEANILIKPGLVDALGGVPDYNMQVTVEKVGLNGTA